MNEILLTDTIPSHADLERLHLFAGRHMGEEEFDRQQAYMDRRMAPLLAHAHPGVIHGLQVRVGEFSSGQEGFTVSPGLALAGNGQSVGLYYPLRESWSTLIEDYLKETGAADASGVYYLTLRRSNRYIDADPNVKPCHRDEFDPTRDARRVLVGTLGLKRLSIDSMAVSAYSRERIENWVAANHVDGNFLESMYNAVPIGLLAVENTGVDEDGQPIYGVSWFSEEAGRYHAIADSGYHVLLQQVTNAFRRILLSADEVVDDDYTLQDYINDKLHLDFLPAAGELPKELILDIASTSPGVTWLPNHLAVDMLAVPEESVNELIERHLPRRVIDLRQPSGDRVRLLLTVNEPDYKPDLLDYPQTDQRLHDDIFRYYMRAYNVWAQWMGKFNQLYFLTEEDILDAEQLAILELPDPLASPQLPEDFFQQVIDESVQELGRDADEQLHYPYRLGVPPYPVFYRSWGLVDESLPDGPVLPPPVEDPEQDGLVIRYTIGQVELEALDNEIRAIRARLEKTRDYLLLQRQQLDSQTVSLAALAGGVAGDGSGLQVARWLPFSKLTAASVEATAEPPEEAPSIPLTSRNVSLAPFSFAHISSIADTARSLTSKVSEAQQAATKNNFVFSSTLRKTPTALSTLQFTLNNQRLDRITEASKVAITRPAFEAKEFRFGVLEHIRPEIQEYKKAIRGMRELITTVEGLFDPNESRSIKAQLNKFGSPKSLEQLSLPNSTLTSEQLAPVLYESLFEAGKILTQQIAYMEGRYARIEANLEGKLRSRVNQEARQDKLIALIRRATEQLENIDKRRIEYLGDYGVAQRLLDDDWLNVYKQNLERTRILTTGVKGLYFVRERQAPITQALADPLPLRYGKAG
ncbi:MAG: hypothetical protein PVI52_00275, partial [Chromatiales bacterium]